MPRSPPDGTPLPVDPWTKHTAKRLEMLATFIPKQRRYMHWYLDEQIDLVYRLFKKKYGERTKESLTTAIMRIQKALEKLTEPNETQPQQPMNGYPSYEIRVLAHYVLIQTEDVLNYINKKWQMERKDDAVSRALMELRIWQIS